MPKSYWTKIQTPNGLKYFRADDVTDELLQKIRDEADDVFYAEYGVTSFDDIKAAYDAGKKICAVRTASVSTYVYELAAYIDNQAFPNLRSFVFTCLDRGTQMTMLRYPSNWDLSPDKSFADNNAFLALVQSIAPSYNNIPCPIAEGTYAMNGNTLYRANTTITSEGTYASWDPEQWDAVTVGGRMKRLDDEVYKNVAYVDILQTPFSEVLSLYNQGNNIVAHYTNTGTNYYLTYVGESFGAINRFEFQGISGPAIYTWVVTSNGPSESNNWSTPPNIYYNASIYSIAAQYDETNTYSVGDVVSRYDSLYRCNTDISVAEQWTPAHWTATSIDAELKRLKNEQPVLTYSFSGDSYPSGADIWNAVSTGHIPMLKRTQMYVTRIYMMAQYGSHGNERDIYFYSFRNCNILRLHTSNGTTWTWTSSDMYDSSLSSTGTNAVQNKTLYDLINDLQSRVTALEGN